MINSISHRDNLIQKISRKIQLYTVIIFYYFIYIINWCLFTIIFSTFNFSKIKFLLYILEIFSVFEIIIRDN